LQLETERADREEIEAELSELKQNSAPVTRLSNKSTADAATIISQLRARGKKSKTDLADLEAILEILES
jgi:ABC-type transporter Mla subunit MlaD